MSFDWQASSSVAASDEAFSRTSYQPPVSRSHHGEGQMQKSLSGFTGKVLGKPERDSGATVKRDNVVFLKSQARRVSAKEGAGRTGMSPKGFQKLQQGENTISFDKLIEWCRNDPDFGAAFCEYIGVLRPGEAEFAAALTRTFQAYQRKQGRE